MITIIGTGHVFNICEPMMFFVKHIWPDCVLVELDEKRFGVLNAPADAVEQKPEENKDDEKAWIYTKTAEYQKRMAEEHGSTVGAEMITAVNTGKLVGAEIGFIDIDASNIMEEIWNEMSAREKMRYSLSSFKERFSKAKDADKVAEEFGTNGDKMIADMRKKYPTLVRKLIDERNDHMSKEILRYAERFNNIVVVVGDAHVEGISQQLEGKEIRKIRLGDILDPDKQSKIRAELWNSEGNES